MKFKITIPNETELGNALSSLQPGPRNCRLIELATIGLLYSKGAMFQEKLPQLNCEIFADKIVTFDSVEAQQSNANLVVQQTHAKIIEEELMSGSTDFGADLLELA